MGHKATYLMCAASLLASAVFAQAPPPLDLKLPPGVAPASSATAARPSSSTTMARPAATPPGAYYGDTSGRMGNIVASAPACDDSTYNKPQVHGNVGMGVMSGNRIGTGSYETGTVNVSKRYGSCDQPSGGVSMSISVGQSHFGPRGH